MASQDRWDEEEVASALRAVGASETEFADAIGVLWPACVVLATKARALRAIGATDDDFREVALRVLQRLDHDHCRAVVQLPDWLERHPDKTTADWLRIVVTNAARDFVRARAGSRPSDPEQGLSPKALLNVCALTLSEEHGSVRPPVTAAQTAREVMEFAARHLPPDQSQALGQWLAGAGFDEIRETVGARTAEDAQKLVRAAVASLRRHFPSM